jgi:hypothetical protein
MRGCPNEPGSLFSDAQHTEQTVCCQIIRLVPGRLTFSQKPCEHPARSQHRLRVVLMPSRPFQKPHPPIRMATNSSDTFTLAGRLGFPMCSSLVVVPLPHCRKDIAVDH